MTFRVGQEVVCVDASDPAGRHGIRAGTVYVLTGLDREFVMIGETGKCLWYRARFRPLIERKTDISVFTKLLTPAPELV